MERDFQWLSTHKHDSGVRRFEARIKKSVIGVGELDSLNGSVQDRSSPGL